MAPGDPMIHWWIWAILAALGALAEMHLPGGYLIWIAGGAAVTSVVSAIARMSIEAQLALFVVASALSCLCGYFAYRGNWRVTGHNALLNERTATLVGTRGVVNEAIAHGTGKVRVGDSVWLAEGPDLPAGTPVVIRSVLGMRLRVESDQLNSPADTT
ncbi:MAG TPA: NfeD family protein [Acetobacteraceae bacterium]